VVVAFAFMAMLRFVGLRIFKKVLLRVVRLSANVTSRSIARVYYKLWEYSIGNLDRLQILLAQKWKILRFPFSRVCRSSLFVYFSMTCLRNLPRTKE
jgi:hypothetical protein